MEESRKSAITGAASRLSGRHISGGDTGLVLSAEADGSFSIVSPSIDQGSGTHTILRQFVADQMKVPVEQVRVVIGDTDTRAAGRRHESEPHDLRRRQRDHASL